MEPNRTMVVLSNLQVEAASCPDCDTPFMLSVVEAVPLGGISPLVLPGKNEKEAGNITAKPVKAWRVCMHCLRREITRPAKGGRGWEMVKVIHGTIRPNLRKQDKDDLSVM